MVCEDFKFSELKTTFKKKLKLDDKTKSLFIFCGKALINEDQTLKFIYEKYKDKEDGFLYLIYSDTEIFGK